MTPEERELLFKDLCSRLPYGVKLQKTYDTSDPVELYLIDLGHHTVKFYKYKGEGITICDVGDIERFGQLRFKPYLFPLSSMTEEQKRELLELTGYEARCEESCGFDSWGFYVNIVGEYNYEDNQESIILYPDDIGIDWLDKNHFDYRGLIPKDLALDATGLSIYQ